MHSQQLSASDALQQQQQQPKVPCSLLLGGRTHTAFASCAQRPQAPTRRRWARLPRGRLVHQPWPLQAPQPPYRAPSPCLWRRKRLPRPTRRPPSPLSPLVVLLRRLPPRPLRPRRHLQYHLIVPHGRRRQQLCRQQPVWLTRAPRACGGGVAEVGGQVHTTVGVAGGNRFTGSGHHMQRIHMRRCARPAGLRSVRTAGMVKPCWRFQVWGSDTREVRATGEWNIWAQVSNSLVLIAVRLALCSR